MGESGAVQIFTGQVVERDSLPLGGGGAVEVAKWVGGSVGGLPGRWAESDVIGRWLD